MLTILFRLVTEIMDIQTLDAYVLNKLIECIDVAHAREMDGEKVQNSSSIGVSLRYRKGSPRRP